MIFKKKKSRFLNSKGFKKEILPIASKFNSGFLLRMSRNSSFIFLCIRNIAYENYYKHSIGGFIRSLPEHLSFSNSEDFISNYVAPYISSSFDAQLNTHEHHLLIGFFYRYYFTRFPVLVKFARYVDFPEDDIGMSEEDLREITAYASICFEELYPEVYKKLTGANPQSSYSIYEQYDMGKEMASKYKYDDKEMQAFLYDFDEVWPEIINIFPNMIEDDNIYLVVEGALRLNFNMFWDSFLSDYKDTLLAWSATGAYNGEKREISKSFWDSLDARLDRNGLVINKR